MVPARTGAAAHLRAEKGLAVTHRAKTNFLRIYKYLGEYKKKVPEEGLNTPTPPAPAMTRRSSADSRPPETELSRGL